MRFSGVYEGLEEETSPGRFGGHALISSEISSVNDDVSCSLRRNNAEKIPEREVTTYPTNETTLKEPRLAVRRPKKIKKCGKRNHLPVVVRSTREKMEGSEASGLLYDRRELWYYVMCDIFLPRGVQLCFSFILDVLKSGS